eukprot:XP_016665043.1 PREDICTED: uncharacterized protein LOC100573731 [Acyrthosiphon pisum]
MGFCFLCDKKLHGVRKQVCSSITQHSNIPYPEKIAELMGDEFLIIVTSADHMCKNCTSLLTHMDKLENDLKLVKNAMLSYIQNKYGILPPDQAVKGVEIVNGHIIKAEDQLEKVQCDIPTGLTVGVSSTVTTAAVVTSVQTPLKLLKTQHQQQHQPHQQQKQLPTQQESTKKMKIYKCGICTFKSKELGHVQFHMRSHTNKKESEKPILNQKAAKAITPAPQPKKRLFRCQICSKCFFSRIICLDHIHEDHNQPTQSTSNGERETVDSCLESPVDEDNNQQNHNKGTVDTYMMLNDNVITKESAYIEQEITKEEDDEEDTGMPEQEEAEQETPDSVENKVDEDNANVENKMGDLDIESMLTTIYNDK